MCSLLLINYSLMTSIDEEIFLFFFFHLRWWVNEQIKPCSFRHKRKIIYKHFLLVVPCLLLAILLCIYNKQERDGKYRWSCECFFIAQWCEDHERRFWWSKEVKNHILRRFFSQIHAVCLINMRKLERNRMYMSENKYLI